MSASPSPKPSRWGRAIRRASTLLPGRPATPEAKDRASMSSDREDTDTGSLRRLAGLAATRASPTSRPRPPLTALPRPNRASRTRSQAPLRSRLLAKRPHHWRNLLLPLLLLLPPIRGVRRAQVDTCPLCLLIATPLVLAGSPLTEKSCRFRILSRIRTRRALYNSRNKNNHGKPPVLDKGTDHLTDQVRPPPLIGHTAVGPGGFKDDLEDVPQSNLASDPFAQPLPLPEPETEERTGPGDQVSPPLIDNTAVLPGGGRAVPVPNVPSGSNVPLMSTVPSTPVPQLPQHLCADQYEDGTANDSGSHQNHSGCLRRAVQTSLKRNVLYGLTTDSTVIAPTIVGEKARLARFCV